MSDNNGAGTRVVAVLLPDGWHRIVPGTFSVGPIGIGANADLGMRGFSFEESEAGSPYKPVVLAGPLESIVAVRQVAPASRPIGDLDRARAAHVDQLAVPGGRPRSHPARQS
jgi:hypothetical protein